MSMVHDVAGAAGDDLDPRTAEPDPQLVTDVDDLRRVLVDQPFPAQQDDLIAACLAAGAPSRLACRLSRLSRTRTYGSLEDLCADVVARAGASGTS